MADKIIFVLHSMFFASVRTFSPFPFSHRTYYNLKFTNHSKGLYTHREFLHKTRMHSSRMRTARSSSRHGGISTHPHWEQAPPKSRYPREQAPPWVQAAPSQIPLNFSLGCGPGPHPPQFPPWLWAWTRPPSTSPLGVGLETCKACWDTTPLETCCKACWDTTCNACWDSNLQLWLESQTPVKTLPSCNFVCGRWLGCP